MTTGNEGDRYQREGKGSDTLGCLVPHVDFPQGTVIERPEGLNFGMDSDDGHRRRGHQEWVLPGVTVPT